jgi:hypothetical protein
LSAADYDLTIAAHKQQRPLLALGTLVRDGKSYTLQNAREVYVPPT